MSLIPKSVNPDLQRERQNASFHVEEFALWWHGGADKLKFKRFMDSYFLDDSKENEFHMNNLSYAEKYTAGVRDCIGVAQKLRKLQAELNPGGTDIWPGFYGSEVLSGVMPVAHPFSVHFSLLIDCIRKQGTDEQYEKFGKRAVNLQIGGAFAQTELGHGTFLRGLETRADFDRQTDEFVLNTPTITAYKWWPGGLGHSCNYCVVVAKLYIDQDAKGVAMFVVQLRDEETHMPLPGIDVGDIGPKLGFHAVNNGYLGLKDVRIPRSNMLMRNVQVHRDGTFVNSPVTAALTYFTLVNGRCLTTHNNVILFSLAATIATRYSAVRRQSPINPNEPEPQIIDHVTQQIKLFPEIANCIAYKLVSIKLWQLYDQISEDIKRAEYVRLPEIHALTCSMKALCSADSSAGVERLRLACGGHGYLSSSNLGNLYMDAIAACTYEGENTVLLLQVGRFLMRSYQQALLGEQLHKSVSYLQDFVEEKSTVKWTGSWQNIIEVLQFTTAQKIRIAFENISKRLKAGQTAGEAANNTGIELTQAAELHGRCFVAVTFFEEVTGSSSRSRNPSLNKVLENLLDLFLVHTALRHMNEILRVVNIADAALRSLQERLEQTLKVIRPDAVAICDGFDYNDRNLSSTLGCYDGNVYERIFQEAKNNPMNKEPVPSVFHTHLKPFMKSKI